MGLLGDIGGFLKKAAPFVGMVPGVGTLAAAGIGGLGGALDGGGFRGFAEGAAGGALGGLGGGILGKAGGSGILGSIGSFAKDNPELLLGGLSAFQNARQQAGADRLIQQGIGDSREDMMRARAVQDEVLGGLRGLDTSGLIDMGNPFRNPLPQQQQPPQGRPSVFRSGGQRSGGAGGFQGRRGEDLQFLRDGGVVDPTRPTVVGEEEPEVMIPNPDDPARPLVIPLSVVMQADNTFVDGPRDRESYIRDLQRRAGASSGFFGLEQATNAVNLGGDRGLSLRSTPDTSQFRLPQATGDPLKGEVSELPFGTFMDFVRRERGTPEDIESTIRFNRIAKGR